MAWAYVVFKNWSWECICINLLKHECLMPTNVWIVLSWLTLFKMNTQWQFIICPSNSMHQSYSWAANNHSQPVKKFPTCQENLRFITVYTPTISQHFHNPSIWIQLTFHLKSLRSILILSSYLHLDCQSGLITSAFWIHICYMLSSSHPPPFDHPNISWWGA